MSQLTLTEDEIAMILGRQMLLRALAEKRAVLAEAEPRSIRVPPAQSEQPEQPR